MKSINVIIADDHTLFADGLEQIVQSMEGFHVIAKVTDGKILLQKLKEAQPDIILLDINMPYMDGILVAEHIFKVYPTIKVVFVSMYFSTQMIDKIQKMGANGFIMKDVAAPDLKEALVKIRMGKKVFLSPSYYSFPSKENYTEDDYYFKKYKLTVRELEIIELLRRGRSAKQIAGDLELSVFTVETHKKNIHRKLNVQSTPELIAITNQILIK